MFKEVYTLVAGAPVLGDNEVGAVRTPLLCVQPQKQLFWLHTMIVIVYYTQEILRIIHFCPRRKFSFTGACSHAGY